MCDCKDKNSLADDYNLKRKPHVHADVIKAWADGAVVQARRRDTETWQDTLGNDPKWFDWMQYRIKPEPKPQTDLEKYGVEVGDVWCIDSEIRTVRRIQQTPTYVGGAAVTFTDIRLTLGIGSEYFNRLLFRLGVVNKL